jgi:hypothetical protein
VAFPYQEGVIKNVRNKIFTASCIKYQIHTKFRDKQLMRTDVDYAT